MDKKCFGDCGSTCFALIRKECRNCAFFKERERALEEIKMSPDFHSNKELQKIATAWGA